MPKAVRKARLERPVILKERRTRRPNPRRRNWTGNPIGVALKGKPQNAHWIANSDIKRSRQQFEWPTGGEGGSLGLLENKVRGMLKIRRNDKLQFLRRENTYFVQLYSESIPEKGVRGVQYLQVTNPEIIKGLDFLLDVKRK